LAQPWAPLGPGRISGRGMLDTKIRHGTKQTDLPLVMQLKTRHGTRRWVMQLVETPSRYKAVAM
jgi:hypothetical protein